LHAFIDEAGTQMQDANRARRRLRPNTVAPAWRKSASR